MSIFLERFWRFTPAAFVSNFSPLLVALDDAGHKSPLHFEYKMWNIFTPLAQITQEQMQKTIEELALECESEEHIYFYTSKMRSFEALFHGVSSCANALYFDDLALSEEEMENLEIFLSQKSARPILYFSDYSKVPQKFHLFLQKQNFEIRFFSSHEEHKESRVKTVLDMLEKVSSE